MAPISTSTTPASGVPSNPGTAPLAPSSAPVAPSNSPATSAPSGPDLSGVQSQYDTAQKDFAAAEKTMSAPTPSGYTGPHARLLAMVNGLAIGMANFGKSISTKGKEGGISGVIADENAQKEMQLEQDKANREKQMATAQTMITAGDNAMKLGNMALLLQTLPDEMEQRHAAITRDQTETLRANQEISQSGADFRATHSGLSADDVSSVLSGKGTPEQNSQYISALDPIAAGAVRQFPQDAGVQAAHSAYVVAKTPAQKNAAINQLGAAVKAAGGVLETNLKQAELTRDEFEASRIKAANSAIGRQSKIVSTLNRQLTEARKEASGRFNKLRPDPKNPLQTAAQFAESDPEVQSLEGQLRGAQSKLDQLQGIETSPVQGTPTPVTPKNAPAFPNLPVVLNGQPPKDATHSALGKDGYSYYLNAQGQPVARIQQPAAQQ
jgi:hypothetical protein